MCDKTNKFSLFLFSKYANSGKSTARYATSVPGSFLFTSQGARREETLGKNLLEITNQQHASFGCASTAQLTYVVEKCLRLLDTFQRCLAFKRCSASSLNCRYQNPYIKLKLIELTIKPYQEF